MVFCFLHMYLYNIWCRINDLYLFKISNCSNVAFPLTSTCAKSFTGLCLKLILNDVAKFILAVCWYCVCLLAGMAELHPEECRSRLHRVGQWGQVGNSGLLTAVHSPCSSTSSLSFHPLCIDHFPISPSPNHITAPQAPNIPETLVMGWLFQILTNNQRSGDEAWKSEHRGPLSSRLHSIPAHPWGIWEKERDDRGCDRWFLCDTCDINLGFLLFLCHIMCFCSSFYLPAIISSVFVCLLSFFLFFQLSRPVLYLIFYFYSLSSRCRLTHFPLSIPDFRICRLTHSNANETYAVLWLFCWGLTLKRLFFFFLRL